MTGERKSVAIVGAGPAGLMAAEVLARAGRAVTVYDRMPSVGRKFLLAGRGGLNLTHSEAFERFLERYADASDRLKPALERFSPADLIAWCEGLGQSTYVGSSGRVFPTAMKASKVLRAWLARLAEFGVRFELGMRWVGWTADGGPDQAALKPKRLNAENLIDNENLEHAFDSIEKRHALVFEADGARRIVTPEATLLALGGASWPRFGSDGHWVELLQAQGIAVRLLAPANCGFVVAWPPAFGERFQGAPLQGVGLDFKGHRVRGEAVVTRSGLEGGAVYALAAVLREAIARDGEAELKIDLRPNLSLDQVMERLSTPRVKLSFSAYLRKTMKLAPVAIGLLYEAAARRKLRLGDLPPQDLAALIKAAPVTLVRPASIDRAISSAGGIAFDEIDDAFMLKRKPGVFVAGEMLDWEAPTGGYLLQACFSTGVAAAEGVMGWLSKQGTGRS